MKLTDPQREELKRLAKANAPVENKYTRGKVSRVRNSLRSKGLVRFFNPDGREPTVVQVVVAGGKAYELCEITPDGRKALSGR